MFSRSNVKNATTIYFLDGDQSKSLLTIGFANINLHLILYSSMQIIEQMIIHLWPLQASESMPMDFGGKAAEHLSFFATHVIPFCESEYGFASSAEKRVIGGYSLGGLFSLYAAVKTDLFGTVLSCSSSLWYPGFLDYLKEHLFKAAHPKLYMSVGEQEGMTATNLTADQTLNTLALKNWIEVRNLSW